MLHFSLKIDLNRVDSAINGLEAVEMVKKVFEEGGGN
jgi:hypothetical protein